MFASLAIATLLLAIATVLPLVRHSHWLVRAMDFPRLQIAIVAALLLATQLIILDPRDGAVLLLAAATALCLFWQLWWILPYTPLWRIEVKASRSDDPDRRLAVMTANVLMPNRNSEALVAMVRKHRPDILVTMESDHWWQDRLSVLEDEMPHCVRCPLDNLYGMHVYSRLPFTGEEVAYLVEEDVPSIHLLLRLRSGDEVRMHFVHPAPPSPTENETSQERDSELMVLAKSLSGRDQPVVVTGDLNDVAWSTTTRLFRKLSGLLDPRVGRGIFNTFNAKYRLIRWPLDHLFHSDHFTVKSIQRLPAFGSDHFALLTELVYTPAERSRQRGPAEDSADRKLAEEIIADEPVKAEDVPVPRS